MLCDDDDANEDRRVASIYAERDRNAVAEASPGLQFIRSEQQYALIHALRGYSSKERVTARVLDLGCGNGFWSDNLVEWGFDPSNIVGVDLSLARLQQGRRLRARDVQFIQASGATLPFSDGAFDIVLHSMLLSSIMSAEHRSRIAAEMLRVMSPNGRIIWYDFFTNPLNQMTSPITRSELRRLFPHAVFDVRRVTLAPPVARFLADYSPALAALVSALRLTRTHLCGVIQRKNPLAGRQL